jgi:hypothetical protein
MSTLRQWAAPIGGLAAILLIYLFNPWVNPPEGAVRQVVTVAFWVVFIALLVILFEGRKDPNAEDVEIEGPRFVRFLFHNSRAGLFWLPIRLFVGFAWLEPVGTSSPIRSGRRAEPPYEPTGSALRRSRRRAARRSRSSGTATSSTRS